MVDLQRWSQSTDHNLSDRLLTIRPKTAHCKLLSHLNATKFVTEFWKITHIGVPETIRIFEFSMALLIAERTFLNSTRH